jgi:hypothetical protein
MIMVTLCIVRRAHGEMARGYERSGCVMEETADAFRVSSWGVVVC